MEGGEDGGADLKAAWACQEFPEHLLCGIGPLCSPHLPVLCEREFVIDAPKIHFFSEGGEGLE
jgi:hypothetical protein